jgi:aminoglycoside phosphotransferase (APT) family kinase protein
MSEVAKLLERDEFILEHVWPFVADGTQMPSVDLVHHRHGIVEYRFDGGPRVFAKPFEDVERGSAAYGIQRAFWEHGFGADAGYRVAEPLAFLAEHGVLLIGTAPGRCLRDLRAVDPAAWKAGVRRAAHWLSALHRSTMRVGPLDDTTQRVLHLAQRVAQTVARRPELEPTLVRLLDELGSRALPVGSSLEVQTHGRYHAEHVFLTPDQVTVIDTDRAARGDPAKDVGEFLHRLRADALRDPAHRDAAEQATAAFVEEYTQSGGCGLSSLTFYWSYSVLFTFVARAAREGEDETRKEQRLQLYRGEFEAIPGRVAAYGLSR